MNGQLTPIQRCENFIISLEDQFKRVSHESQSDISFRKEAKFAIQILQENSFLLGIAKNNPDSLKNAIINIAAIGLTLNPIQKLAYLIPRKRTVCLDISYLGLVDIACNSGSIKFVQAKMVYQGDDFQLRGMGEEPIHRYNPFGKRGEPIGVYCVAKTIDNEYLCDTMSMEEIENIRNRSESWKSGKNSPWKSDFGEMAKKTILRRAYKLWPKTKRSRQLETAIDALNQVEGIDFKKEKEEALAKHR